MTTINDYARAVAEAVRGELRRAYYGSVQPWYEIDIDAIIASVPAPDVQAQAQDDSWLCGVKPRLTRDDLHHLRTQFRETMESQGQHDHEYHLENYQCLALNLAPALIAFASDVQAQIDAAVAREREACAQIAERPTVTGPGGVKGIHARAAAIADEIRARSGAQGQS